MNTRGNLSMGSQRNFVIGITLVVGITLGILAVMVIQKLGSSNDQTSDDDTQLDSHQYLTKSVDSGLLENSVEVGKFEEILQHRSVFDQITALRISLSFATEEELKEWWIQSQEIERKSHRESLQDVIARKLATINPQHALQYIKEVTKFQSEDLLRSVFAEWSALQLDAAVEAAGTLSVYERNVALQSILETRDDLSESELHSIAARLDGEHTLLQLVSEAKASDSIANPMESWNLLLNDDVDDSLQTEALAVVAMAWRAEVGFEVLLSIASDIEDFWDQRRLIDLIVQEDPAGALEYAQGLSQRELSDLSSQVVAAWARIDALAALAAVNSMEQSLANVNLESVIASVWAQTKPNELIENIEQISDDLRLRTLESAFSAISRRDPLEALAKLNSVENLVVSTSNIEKFIVMFGSDKNPVATTDWVIRKYSADDPQRRRLLEYSLLHLARQDPERAFELALAQPTPDGELGLESRVIYAITHGGEIELAKKLLPRVKEARTKQSSFAWVGRAMAANLQTDEALELGKELEESERRFYYSRVLNSWASTHPKNLLESLESLPSSDLRTEAASELIRQHEFEPVFTEEQVDLVHTYLNSDD
ncbi:MAG: hypothetical protein F4W92_08555 [Gammaproteobacteria bacterium]|nr:hypothetical protein [Gammaproteobacteria bacterium]